MTVVIVRNVRGRVIEAMVDSVSDVLALDADSFKAALELSGSVNASCIIGFGCIKVDDVERMLNLTDIEALAGSSEMGLIEAALR